MAGIIEYAERGVENVECKDRVEKNIECIKRAVEIVECTDRVEKKMERIECETNNV